MYKYCNRYLPDNFDNYFVPNADVHSYYIRLYNLCHLFSHTTTLPSFDISIAGRKLWNTLPSHIKSCLRYHLLN